MCSKLLSNPTPLLRYLIKKAGERRHKRVKQLQLTAGIKMVMPPFAALLASA